MIWRSGPPRGATAMILVSYVVVGANAHILLWSLASSPTNVAAGSRFRLSLTSSRGASAMILAGIGPARRLLCLPLLV